VASQTSFLAVTGTINRIDTYTWSAGAFGAVFTVVDESPNWAVPDAVVSDGTDFAIAWRDAITRASNVSVGSGATWSTVALPTTIENLAAGVLAGNFVISNENAGLVEQRIRSAGVFGPATNLI